MWQQTEANYVEVLFLKYSAHFMMEPVKLEVKGGSEKLARAVLRSLFILEQIALCYCCRFSVV